MQRLISFSHPRVAQAFVDYMATKNVHIEAKINGDQTELWLADASQLNFTLAELDQFLTNPADKRYSEASWQAGSTDAAFRYQDINYWQIIRQKAGRLTLLVIAVCIAVYLLLLFAGVNSVMDWLAFPADDSQYGEIWRWLTPAFIHFSLMHISFNLVLWWSIGGELEIRLGSAKLLQILLISGLISNGAQAFFDGPNFGGLSGVVYALVGYAWLLGEKAPQLGIQLNRAIMIASVLWLFVGYFDILDPPMANTAHLSGLVVGLALALWDSKRLANGRP
jgi:GlpG protein